MLQTPDWAAYALASEIALSTAYGGTAVDHHTFIHIHNPVVSWCGDFSRAVGVKATNITEFETVAATVTELHRELRLDPPNRFDLRLPVLGEAVWREPLTALGYRLETAIFFQAPVGATATQPALRLYSPTEEEYVAWYTARQQAQPYHNAADFQQLLPLQQRFIQTFKPYWLMHKGELAGWVYCANLGVSCRLFEVEIVEEQRGRGFGLHLLALMRDLAEQEGCAYLLLQTTERLRSFYEKAGFHECTRNSIVWRA